MQFTPYLNFQGHCEAAFNRYAEVFGGRIESLQRWGDSPMGDESPADMRDRVLHAHFVAGDAVLLGSDAPPEHFQPMQGLYVTVATKDAAEGRRVFDALAEGGQVQMPFEKTFWSPGFGMLVDRFGTPWMINTNEDA